MFRPKTLLVLGAGASCEANLPSGETLKGRIAEMLDIRFPDGHNQESGDPRISDCLRKNADKREDRDAFNQLLYKAWAIRDGMPLAISIDNYLDAHRGDRDLELVGKLAIAASILDAEERSHMKSPPDDTLPMRELLSTWYVRFVRLLTENVAEEDLDEAVARVSILTFNYDRTLEHFLRHALKVYYGLGEREAERLVSGLRILHPYGKIGELPWQNPDGNSLGSVRFGGPVIGTDLLAAARQIRTFGERVDDAQALAAIKGMVDEAETVVFLGFGFHRQNIDLISPRTTKRFFRRVFASVYGVSESDQREIQASLQVALRTAQDHPQISARDVRIEMYAGTCAGLLDEFRLTLTE